MPELPEVEVTRRQLESAIVGRTIARVDTTGPSYFFLSPPRQLANHLPGRTATALHRHGKYLVLSLDDGRRLLLHLGMTGQLFTAGSASVRLLSATRSAALTPEHQLAAFEPDQHTHLRLSFHDAGPAVYFRDTRKFGKVQLLAPGEPCERLERLGVDALSATGDEFHAVARKRRTPIKNVLLDQRVVAGIGNIYADEALFVAGIRPGRRADRVSAAQCAQLIDAAQRVMQRSIETGGTSISDYVRPDGSDGGYQDERRVYARQGQPCSRCGSAIRRKVISQRSAHYCPRCQR